ncbi:hypothetical protein NQ318_018393 [Aromia moschata]|uniref:Uncharacterized protein n=1 Tax=Aromia moschata TaxID=1265417 RepID=A0AAV8ZE82_9CUCU|nr:hypothetical protein NQ318_018393 [Aromia moschata]
MEKREVDILMKLPCQLQDHGRKLKYEVCKLSNKTDNVGPDLATLWTRDLEIRMLCSYNDP